MFAECNDTITLKFLLGIGCICTCSSLLWYNASNISWRGKFIVIMFNTPLNTPCNKCSRCYLFVQAALCEQWEIFSQPDKQKPNNNVYNYCGLLLKMLDNLRSRCSFMFNVNIRLDWLRKCNNILFSLPVNWVSQRNSSHD